MTTGTDNFVDITAFADIHHKQLQQIFPQHQTTPTHNTTTHTFTILTPLPKPSKHNSTNYQIPTKTKKIKKTLHTDGKTQKDTQTNNTQTPNHIVSVVDNHNFFLTQELAKDKSNEITTIPKLLDNLNLKGHTLTYDAIGTQREIVVKIRQRQAN